MEKGIAILRIVADRSFEAGDGPLRISLFPVQQPQFGAGGSQGGVYFQCRQIGQFCLVVVVLLVVNDAQVVVGSGALRGDVECPAKGEDGVVETITLGRGESSV